MICKKQLLIALLLASLATAAAGAPNWKVDQKSLPAGMTKAEALSMLETIDKASAQEREKSAAASKRQVERVQRAAKKYEDQLKRAVDKDPELKATMARLDSEFKALGASGLSDEDRSKRFEKLAPELSSFRQKAFAKAGLDENALKSDIRREMGSGVSSRGGEGDPQGELHFDEGGGFSMVYPDAAAETDSAEGPSSEIMSRGSTTKYLRKPFPISVAVRRSGAYGWTNPPQGLYMSQSSAGFPGGSGTNRYGLAHVFTVPTSTTHPGWEVKVVASLPGSSYSSYAYGWGPGIAHSSSWSEIDVWTVPATRHCRVYRQHANLWALVLGSFKQSSSSAKTLEMNCKFYAGGGQTIVINLTSYVHSSAAGWASTSGWVRGQPADVTVYLTN